MTTMSSWHTALDLLQNGGITCGIDMFLDVFWTLHDNVPGQELQWLFRNTFAACFAFASEFGRLWCNFVSWMCMTFLTIGLTRFFQQPTETNFLPNCVAFFLEAACRLQQHRGEEECFWNL